MNFPTKEEIDLFANALQLCIDSEIESVDKPSKSGHWLSIVFKNIKPNDCKLDIFVTLLGQPDKYKDWQKDKTLIIFQPAIITKLTPFLMLTRLDETNMRALAQQDPQYRPLLDMLKNVRVTPAAEATVHNVFEASRYLFDIFAQRGFTLRHLAEQSGLTQVTISNIKSGQDVRLSNFFKLAEIAGLDIVLKQK